MHEVVARLYFLPISDWSQLSRKVLKNDLKVFESGISFMRSDREVDFKHWSPGIAGKGHHRDSWWRLEIDFPAQLDEAFGVAMNKQGVRPKGFVQESIAKAISSDLLVVSKAIEQNSSQRASEQAGTAVTAAEQRANEAEPFQSTVLQQPSPQTPEEHQILDENLRTLAVTLKRESETGRPGLS